MLRITSCLLAIASMSACSGQWRPLPYVVAPAALCGDADNQVFPLADWAHPFDAVVVAKVDSLEAANQVDVLQMQDCTRPQVRGLVMRMTLDRTLAGVPPSKNFATIDAFSRTVPMARPVDDETNRIRWELGCDPEAEEGCTTELMDREIRPGQLLGLGLTYAGLNIYNSQRFSLPPDDNFSFPDAFPRNDCAVDWEFVGRPSAEVERALAELPPPPTIVEDGKASLRRQVDLGAAYRCTGEGAPPAECVASPDCAAGNVCTDGACVPKPPAEQ